MCGDARWTWVQVQQVQRKSHQLPSIPSLKETTNVPVAACTRDLSKEVK